MLAPRALSKTLQRYENKSKSQRYIASSSIPCCCLRLCKDTKIKANHNEALAVVWQAKLSKTLQRYENKSKSQLVKQLIKEAACCLRLCKDTKIKANHNDTCKRSEISRLSKTLQRYENKSKSQLYPKGTNIG